ncbi:cupin domain-containing protein [Sulfurimonas denitrificans]|uniref:cupin domain-containing protein n=1 Tax=Sulfurimonas denitrificans TaxID=39766 RepID=UPI001EE22457|nr:cupin domain-containing protein [Sulfurimonas denitrificans]MDD3442812.1 cupin domain-containing protein [Sulfurimonas denitrificans]
MSILQSKNIFSDIPASLKEEFFETLLSSKNIKIERIISYGHVTKEGEWYDQSQNEWVILLSGEAVLLFVDGEEVHLRGGDYINIPAHKKHRVSWTTPKQESVWLAIHY